MSEPYHSPYDVPLPSPVGALIGFYEGVNELSTDDMFLLSVLWNLAHAEKARDEALALAERRAGGIKRLERIEIAARHLWEIEDARHDFPTWSDAYDRLGAALAAAPPPASEGAGGAG